MGCASVRGERGEFAPDCPRRSRVGLLGVPASQESARRRMEVRGVTRSITADKRVRMPARNAAKRSRTGTARGLSPKAETEKPIENCTRETERRRVSAACELEISGPFVEKDTVRTIPWSSRGLETLRAAAV